MTRKSPDTVSAANIPPGVIVPPDALQATTTSLLSPLADRPYARNLFCWAGSRLRLSGTTMICTTGVLRPVVAVGRSHVMAAATDRRTVSASLRNANPHESLWRYATGTHSSSL